MKKPTTKTTKNPKQRVVVLDTTNLTRAIGGGIGTSPGIIGELSVVAP